MSLREYQKKRDFSRTAEPPPKAAAKPRFGSNFVVQKHDASRLHYDFRLEMEGVLKSWAVPKGFPFASGERHLAVHVEDHPMEYANFEGIIPKGEYGGGTVMVWDVGRYEVLGEEPIRALRRGKLHMLLHGKKLKGEWTLVRTRSDEEKEHWLLLKTGGSVRALGVKRDDQSILTGRSMRQIAEQKTATWKSNRETSSSRVESKPTKAAAREPSSPAAKKPASKPSRRAPLKFIEPMKAKLVEEPPSYGEWVYELKWDGYRALAIKDGESVEIFSRNHKVLTADFPEIRDAVAALPVARAILDGEIVALDPEGRPSFQLLQGRSIGRSRPVMFYYAFDLLHLEDQDLQKKKLCARKEALEQLVDGSEVIRYSAGLEGDVREALDQISALGMEGVIGKLRDSVYEAGLRSGAWIKVKCGREQEFVIGGFTEPRGSRTDLGALLVGYYEGGKLHHAGKVGTGFNQKLLKSLRAQLDPLRTDVCPFAEPPSNKPGRWARKLPIGKATWVKPRLVCQVKFAEWTDEGLLRQPVFLGLREDNDPRKVIRERPAAVNRDG
jgi:bifunctional non-homologous end joining protein LigD